MKALRTYLRLLRLPIWLEIGPQKITVNFYSARAEPSTPVKAKPKKQAAPRKPTVANLADKVALHSAQMQSVVRLLQESHSHKASSVTPANVQSLNLFASEGSLFFKCCNPYGCLVAFVPSPVRRRRRKKKKKKKKEKLASVGKMACDVLLCHSLKG